MPPITPLVHGSTLLLRGDSVLAEISDGLADATSGTACSPRTRYQIASIRKQFTAAVRALLAGTA